MLWVSWWLWAAFALVLAILEILVPGYLFLGFAIGAGVLGAVLWAGGPLADMLTTSIPILLVAYSVVSLVAWGVLRKFLGVQKGQVKIIDKDIND